MDSGTITPTERHAQAGLPESDRSGIDDILQTLHQHAQHVAVSSGRPEPSAPTTVDAQIVPAEAGCLLNWTKAELIREVLRLREELAVWAPGHFGISTPTATKPSQSETARRNPDQSILAVDPPNVRAHSGWSGSALRSKPEERAVQSARPRGIAGAVAAAPAPRKRKREATTTRDAETGKRVEKSRRTELTKAIRTKMKALMGVKGDDPLPHPDTGSTSSDPTLVPVWTNGLDSFNSSWVERACTELLAEAALGLHPAVPADDLAMGSIRSAARTAFLNFVKRYHAENDTVQAERKARYAKNRRRWARKDLKQKRRAKYASDPAIGDVAVPPLALHLDYMSSEHSSAGEDETSDEAASDAIATERREEKRRRRKAEWDAACQAAQLSSVEGKGWAEGQGPKVLEVRTPRWRSKELNDLYARLDDVAAQRSSARSATVPNKPDSKSDALLTSAVGGSTKAGYVAPSHHRFKMPDDLARKGKAPRGLVDA